MVTRAQSFRRIDRCLRFTFRFEDGVITLIDRRELEMKPPATQDLTPFAPAERSGFWVEVQDRQGHALFRQVMPHPMLGRSEGLEGESPRTHLWTLQRGAFSLLVPNFQAGKHLVLCGSPTEGAQSPQPAVELLRLDLNENRNTGEQHDRGSGLT